MDALPTITRYYGAHEQDLEKLWRFIDQAQTYSSRILIGVNVEKDLTDCIKRYSQRQACSTVPVDFIPITPWIGISSPLNILLQHLPTDQCAVLIQSVEIQCTAQHIARLRTYSQMSDVLCAGAALDGHQQPDPKSSAQHLPLRGDTSPWNTLAIWDLARLRRTGFPMSADEVRPPGMEDAAAIGLQQKLFGGRTTNRALLVRFGGEVHWSTQFEYDGERNAKHQAKMNSKNSRTEQLLATLGISSSDHVGVEYISE